MTEQGRRELARAFLRLLRRDEPGMIWRLLPDEREAILDGGTATSAGSGRDLDPLEDGAE
jgi:hypothetical protein